MQTAQLQALAGARDDEAFAGFVASVPVSHEWARRPPA
jgi:hypothetical protein